VSPLRLPISALRFSKTDWARNGPTQDRVELFAGLSQDDSAEIEPIWVVPNGDGTYTVADGNHRARGAVAAGCTEIDAVVLSHDADELVGDFLFRIGLETTNRAALPLTKAEQRRAVLRLLERRPEMSHRAIARLVGVSHDTVDRWAGGVADSASDQPGEAPSASRLPTADEAARRLVGFLSKLDESPVSRRHNPGALGWGDTWPRPSRTAWARTLWPKPGSSRNGPLWRCRRSRNAVSGVCPVRSQMLLADRRSGDKARYSGRKGA
jgi:hypothetical protein